MQNLSGKNKLSERIAFLRTVPLFAGLQPQDLETLIPDFRLREYNKDEIIFHQGDESNEMYIVVKGKIRIFKTSPAGGETSISIFASGDIIGEFATIDHQPRSATAKAIVPTILLQIRSEKFVAYMRQIPDLALALAKLLTEKTRWNADFIETIAQFDAAGRLLHILLLYNEKLGQELEPGKRYLLDLSLNQTDLASLVGARREWINRILRDWQKRGLIEYRNGKLTILDLPRVEAERDSRIESNYH